MVGGGWLADIRASYDTVAAGYADLVRDTLPAQPGMRALPPGRHIRG